MKKLKTNVELVTDMMEFSQAGALKQAFIIEAIHNYSQDVVAAENASDGVSVSFISPQAWKLCAKECLDAISSRNTI